MNTKVTAMINLAYFAANFTPKFIMECWEGDKHLIEHLTAKLLSHANGCVVDSGAFMKFFFELSFNNQIQLCLWIDDNYKGISE